MTIIIITVVLMITFGGLAYYIQRQRALAEQRDVSGRFAATVKRRDRTSRTRLPYRYADDLIFISGGTVWTGLILPDFTDEYAGSAEAAQQATFLGEIDLAMLGLIGDSVDVHDVLRYKETDSTAWYQNLLGALWNPSERYKVLLRRAGEVADETSPTRVFMRFVCLGEWTGRTSPGLLSFAESEVTGVAEESFDASDLKRFRERALRLRDGLEGYRVRGMNRAELLWAIRKTFTGHLEPTKLRTVATRPWGPGFFDTLGGFRGYNHGNHVELHRSVGLEQEQETHVAVLVIVDRPGVEAFDVNHGWYTALRQAGISIEFSERFRLITGAAWDTMAKKMVANIQDEANNRIEAGVAYDAGFQQTQEAAALLRDQIDTNNAPCARIGRLRLVVSAATTRLLDQAVTDVLQSLPRTWTVEAPDKAQYLLLEETLPGDAPTVNLGRSKIRAVNNAGGGGLGLWERTTDHMSTAIGGVVSHNQVGDSVEEKHGTRRGWVDQFIGRMLTTGAPVHFAPHVQIDRDLGAGVGLFGATGFGKSMLATYLFFNESESGVSCTALDLKNDFERYFYYLAFGEQVLEPGFGTDARNGVLGTSRSRFQPVDIEFWRATQIVDLARGQAGLLDPWALCDSFSNGETLARDLVLILFPNEKDADLVRDVIAQMKENLTADAARKETGKVGLGHVADIVKGDYQELAEKNQSSSLAEHETTRLQTLRRVNNDFDRLREASFSKLLFGVIDTDGVTFGEGKLINPDRRRTIITMNGFTPPTESDPTRWSSTDRGAAAAVHATMNAVYQAFDSTERPNPVTGQMGTPPRSIYIDEAKMLIGQPAGRLIISKALRQGRSLNLCIVLITQQANDLSELESTAAKSSGTEVNQIGTVFCFANMSPHEALDALQLLRDTSGLSKDEEMRLARKLMPSTSGGSLSNSVAVMRDADGNVGAVAVTPVFKELVRAGQTNARLRPIDQANPVPANAEDWELIVLEDLAQLDVDPQPFTHDVEDLADAMGIDYDSLINVDPPDRDDVVAPPNRAQTRQAAAVVNVRIKDGTDQ